MYGERVVTTDEAAQLLQSAVLVSADTQATSAPAPKSSKSVKGKGGLKHVFIEAPKEQLDIGMRPGMDAVVTRMPRSAELLSTYRSVLGEIAQSEASARARSMRLSDDLVVVVLARVLGSDLRA